MKGGTPDGAKRAIKTKRKKYGEDFFKINGVKGGLVRNLSEKAHFTFMEDRELARRAGRKGANSRWDKYRAAKKLEKK